MGHFSNGTEGEDYRANFCDHCANDNGSCAVWLVHLLYVGDKKTDELRNLLIPVDAEGWNLRCKMFRPKLEPRMTPSRTANVVDSPKVRPPEYTGASK